MTVQDNRSTIKLEECEWIRDLVRRDMSARKADGVLHNLNSLLQIVSGQAALMKRDDPKNKRVTKLIKGLERMQELALTLVSARSKPRDLRETVQEALDFYGSMALRGEAKAAKLKGASFTVNAYSTALLEAFMLSLCDAETTPASIEILFDPVEHTMILSGVPPFELGDGLLCAMKGAGMMLCEEGNLQLLFENAAFEGI